MAFHGFDVALARPILFLSKRIYSFLQLRLGSCRGIWVLRHSSPHPLAHVTKPRLKPEQATLSDLQQQQKQKTFEIFQNINHLQFCLSQVQAGSIEQNKNSSGYGSPVVLPQQPLCLNSSAGRQAGRHAGVEYACIHTSGRRKSLIQIHSPNSLVVHEGEQRTNSEIPSCIYFKPRLLPFPSPRLMRFVG